MRRAFTLIEMMLGIFLLLLMIVSFDALLASIKKEQNHYNVAARHQEKTNNIHKMLLYDLTQLRSKPQVIHEHGYDRITFYSNHSYYGIPRPWIHYYISRKNLALIRIESTQAIDFKNTKDSYFFADTLAEQCQSLRFYIKHGTINCMIRCKTIDPIVATFTIPEP